jgi:hypothetical protein
MSAANPEDEDSTPGSRPEPGVFFLMLHGACGKMKIANGQVNEVEQERQREIAQRVAEDGDSWSEGYQPGTPGCHELLDRTSIIVGMLEEYLLSHPACLANSDWYSLAQAAAHSLQDLYQAVGAEHMAAK